MFCLLMKGSGSRKPTLVLSNFSFSRFSLSFLYFPPFLAFLAFLSYQLPLPSVLKFLLGSFIFTSDLCSLSLTAHLYPHLFLSNLVLIFRCLMIRSFIRKDDHCLYKLTIWAIISACVQGVPACVRYTGCPCLGGTVSVHVCRSGTSQY